MKIFTDVWHYANWIPNAVRVSTIEEADIVLFSGGDDVHPKLYGDRTGMYTSTNLNRDRREIEWFNKAVELNKFILGICRGLR
jgi:putative glutamine amidotransferase